MVILYNIGLCFFYGALLLASVFNRKARKWIKGRKAVTGQLKKQFAGKDKVMWMHCSSLGEFEQGRPLLEKFREQNPQYKILLTFFSPSGYEMRKNYDCADYVSYLPLDTWINARKFIKAVHPQVVFFVKYDFWYHHLHQAKKSGAKLYLISALFRPKQVFFKWYGGFFRSMLQTFSRIFVQNEESEKLLQKIGFTNLMVAGDTRIDRVRQIAEQAKDFPVIAEFVNNSPCLVCGSTWANDENVLEPATRKLNKVKLIIAPHEIHESHIVEIETLFADRRIVRYTQAAGKDMKQYDVLIIDTIGMLSSVYRYGQAAYIGGGFGDGIHNTLEAVVYGIPVVFGSNYDEFIEAVELIALGGAKSINNADGLKAVLDDWFGNNTTSRELAGEVCKNYIWKQKNASEKILQDIYQYSRP